MPAQSTNTNGHARSTERPTKRARLLSDTESSDSSDEESGGVPLNGKEPELGFRVNEEYAKRFEHNQKRAELHRLEEKFGPAGNEEDEESSSDEDEDDDGILASGALDAEVMATLKALRSKDPAVYDARTKFYTTTADDNDEINAAGKDSEAVPKEKPIFLHDYHRQNLLNGGIEEEEEEEQEPTYAQQQDNLRNSIVKEMHAAAEGSDTSSEDDNEEHDTSFLVKKARPAHDKSRPKTLPPIISYNEIKEANKDPEGFLTKFMDSRAWVAPTNNNLHPFESDDEEEERRAEELEQAYNLRYEDPKGANEKLVSHARDIVAKHSVRQEPINKRKRAREAEQEKKQEVVSERSQEKARLRKLRLEETEAKVLKIKEAAGLGKQALDLEEWQGFLTADWDDDRWEAEMRKKFGEDYYADKDLPSSDEEAAKSKRKVKKPKWDDDIDIVDLVPDFDPENDAEFSLSDEGSEGESGPSSSKKSRERKLEKEEQKREAKKERRRLEKLVDEKLEVDLALNGTNRKGAEARFRYRETSPIAYGLTPKDILMASDSQLNQFAGLKKMAAFRDPEKKRKDKKQLGKKARLRQWRRDAFGDENGPQKSLQDLLRETQGYQPEAASKPSEEEAVGETREGKKRKRSKKTKAPA